ncbi:MAG: hypothetical protein R3C60_14630 [Parvularculaceae bacterium]
MSAEYLDNAVIIGGPETEALCLPPPRRAGIDVVIGVAGKTPRRKKQPPIVRR